MAKNVTISELINIQHACNDSIPVADDAIINWLSLLLEEHSKCAELNVRFVSTEEITNLNKTYRSKDGPTNVLAFPFSKLPKGLKLDFDILGDVIISPEIVKKESIEQKKPYIEHFAHILIHGALHLLGFDHEYEEESTIMQNLEKDFLMNLGFSNPY